MSDGAQMALLERLEVDQDPSAVQRGVGTIDPNERRQACTAGSCRITLVSSCWRSAMAGNEMESGASDIPWMMPVS